MLTKLQDPAVRKWIYGIVVALVPVLVATGFIFPGLDQTLLLLVAAILGVPAVGLAAKNTDTSTNEAEDETELVDEDSELLGE